MYFANHPSPQMSIFRRICAFIKAQQNEHNLCCAFFSRKNQGRTTHKAFCFDIRAGSDQDLHDLSIALLHGFVKGRIAAEAFGCVDIRTRFNQKPHHLDITLFYGGKERLTSNGWRRCSFLVLAIL